MYVYTENIQLGDTQMTLPPMVTQAPVVLQAQLVPATGLRHKVDTHGRQSCLSSLYISLVTTIYINVQGGVQNNDFTTTHG
jgi:hypothetical protein